MRRMSQRNFTSCPKYRIPISSRSLGYLLHGDSPIIVAPWMERASLRKGIESRQLERSENGMIHLARGVVDGLMISMFLHSDLKYMRGWKLSIIQRPKTTHA